VSTPQSSPTRQRSTKSTKTTTTITAVVHNRSRNLPSDDSDVEEHSSPSKPKGFHALFGKSPAKQKPKWETRTDNNIREITSQRRGNSFDGVSPRRGAVKDVVGPPAAAATVDLGAGLGSEGQRRGRTVSDVGTSSPVAAAAPPGGRKLEKTRAGGGGGPPVSMSAAAAAGENWSMMSRRHQIFHILQSCDTSHAQASNQAYLTVLGGSHHYPSSSTSTTLSGASNHLFRGWAIRSKKSSERAALIWRGLNFYEAFILPWRPCSPISSCIFNRSCTPS
jgi:hypothetical protein